ncbi:hypothetical protein AC630_16615 [Bradyrhizobium sp. AS23.2]|nr:hypothetical protein AC630_16615 [Bradyrhizobium sp. AS23.2]
MRAPSKILYDNTELSQFTGSSEPRAFLLCMGLFSTFLSEQAASSSCPAVQSAGTSRLSWAGERRRRLL